LGTKFECRAQSKGEEKESDIHHDSLQQTRRQGCAKIRTAWQNINSEEKEKKHMRFGPGKEREPTKGKTADQQNYKWSDVPTIYKRLSEQKSKIQSGRVKNAT